MNRPHNPQHPRPFSRRARILPHIAGRLVPHSLLSLDAAYCVASRSLPRCEVVAAEPGADSCARAMRDPLPDVSGPDIWVHRDGGIVMACSACAVWAATVEASIRR